MSHDLHAQLDQSVLEMIEHSPVGAVPHTPTYQDALRRLYATHQVYPSADHKDGHVTARSLARAPLFYAENLDAVVANPRDIACLESNASIFARYLASLPAGSRAKAEAQKARVVGRPVLHRKHTRGEDSAAVHDPVHSLFLVPGGGRHAGLPGNYLHGSLNEVPHPGSQPTWTLVVHDAEDDLSTFEAVALTDALAMLKDLLASAPFHLGELAALGFKTT